MQYCPKCGKALRFKAQQFCDSCGFNLLAETVGPVQDNAQASGSASAAPASPAAPAASWSRPVQPAPAASWSRPAQPAPSFGGSASTIPTPQNLMWAAGCAAALLVATFLPWGSVLGLVQVSGAQVVWPLVPPIVALAACGMMHSRMPETLTSGKMYALRISFGVAAILAVLVISAFGQSVNTGYGYSYSVSSVAQPGGGLFLYLIASVAGLVLSFRIPLAHNFPG